MSNPFSECAEGVRVRVRVIPKAGSNSLGEVRDGAFVVRVTVAPEHGKANAAVIKLLAKKWSLPSSTVEVVAGATSRDKTLLLRGARLEDLPPSG